MSNLCLQVDPFFSLSEAHLPTSQSSEIGIKKRKRVSERVRERGQFGY